MSNQRCEHGISRWESCRECESHESRLTHLENLLVEAKEIIRQLLPEEVTNRCEVHRAIEFLNRPE